MDLTSKSFYRDKGCFETDPNSGREYLDIKKWRKCLTKKANQAFREKILERNSLSELTGLEYQFFLYEFPNLIKNDQENEPINDAYHNYQEAERTLNDAGESSASQDEKEKESLQEKLTLAEEVLFQEYKALIKSNLEKAEPPH